MVNGTLGIQVFKLTEGAVSNERYCGSLTGDVVEENGIPQDVCYSVIRVLFLMECLSENGSGPRKEQKGILKRKPVDCGKKS